MQIEIKENEVIFTSVTITEGLVDETEENERKAGAALQSLGSGKFTFIFRKEV